MEALSRVLGETIGEHILWLIVTEGFMAGMLSLQGTTEFMQVQENV